MSQYLLETITHSNQVLNKIRYRVAIAAGKGGVGKSSVAVNLALKFHSLGYSVGILDADIYGPSLAKMLSVDVPCQIDPKDENKLLPAISSGIKTMSISYLKKEQDAMIVRAPIANGVILQFLHQVSWGELDYLFVDFPPGTGDVQLTLMQGMSFSAGILVTMPQEIALIDVKKAAQMFHQMNVPILGVIENMAYFEELKTQERHYLFGKEGGRKLADLYGTPFLGEVPIDPLVCQCGDQGRSLFQASPEGPAAHAYHSIALQAQNILYDLESSEGSYLKQFELLWQE